MVQVPPNLNGAVPLSLGNMHFGDEDDDEGSFIVLDRMTAEDSDAIESELAASVRGHGVGAVSVDGNLNSGPSQGQGSSNGIDAPFRPSLSASGIEQNGGLVSSMFNAPYSLPSDVQQRMESLAQDNEELQVTVDQTNVALRQMMNTLSQWRLDTEKVRQEHKEKFQETRALVLRLKKEKAEMRAFIEEQDQKVKELQTKIQELQTRPAMPSLFETVGCCSHDYQAVEAKDFTQHIDELTARLLSREDELQKAQSEIARLKDQNDSGSENVPLSQAKGTIERLRTRIDEMTANIVALEERSESQTQEIRVLQEENDNLHRQNEAIGILKAQMELYRTDFISERDAREQLAGEKEQLAEDLRRLHRRNLEYEEELQRRGNAATTAPTASGSTSIVERENEFAPEEGDPSSSTFRCPSCQTRTFRTLQALNEHLDICLNPPDQF